MLVLTLPSRSSSLTLLMNQPTNAFARLAALAVITGLLSSQGSTRSHRRHKHAGPGDQFDDDCHITQTPTTRLAKVSGPFQSPKAGRSGCPAKRIETVGNERADSSPSKSFGTKHSTRSRRGVVWHQQCPIPRRQHRLFPDARRRLEQESQLRPRAACSRRAFRAE